MDPTPSATCLVLVPAPDESAAPRLLALVEAARAMGLSVVVVRETGAERAALEAAGARLAVCPIGGSRLNPMAAGYGAGQLAGLLKAVKADIVHAVGLRATLVGGSAAAMAGVGARLYAPGDLARMDTGGRLARTALRHLIQGPLTTARTRFLFASPEEARALGLDPADTGVAVAEDGAAGVRAACGFYADLAAGTSRGVA